MSLYHRCHTCGAEYPCNARWCPKCGKRLGHRDERGKSAYATVELDSGWGVKERYRCASCGDVSIDVYEPRYCMTCGARFTSFIDSKEMAEARQKQNETRKLFRRKARELGIEVCA